MLLGRFDETTLMRINGSRLWRTSAFTILLFFSMIWYSGFWYLSNASAVDPTSYFFDRVKGYRRIYSLRREEQALAYIKTANKADFARPASRDSPSMCIGIATIDRKSEKQYVEAAVGSVLEGLTDAERAQIYLILFVAHTDPSRHPIYQELWPQAVSNEVLTYNVSNNDLKQLRLFEEEHHPRNKSMYDYGYLLQKCLGTGAEWISIIEDDVIARSGWYDMACLALKEVQNISRGASWLYLRMFYTENLLGWNGEEWPRYLSWSLLLFVIVSLGLLGSRARSPLLRRHLSNSDIATVSCFCLPALIGLYFMAGRMTVQPPSPGVRSMPRFGCCSQGFVFPRSIVPEVIQRVEQARNEDYYIDMLFERFADARGLGRYAQFPSLLQHVGLQSSKGWGYDGDAALTWNFAFERTIDHR